MVVVTVSAFAAGAYGVKRLIVDRNGKIKKKKKWLKEYQDKKSAAEESSATMDTEGHVIKKAVDNGSSELKLRKSAAAMSTVNQEKLKVADQEQQLTPTQSPSDTKPNPAVTIKDGDEQVELNEMLLDPDWTPPSLAADREIEVESIATKSEPSETGTVTLSDRTPRKIRDVEADPDDLVSVSPTSPVATAKAQSREPVYDQDGQSVTSQSFGSNHSIALSSKFTSTTRGTAVTQMSTATMDTLNTVASQASSAASAKSIANSDVFTESRDKESSENLNGSPKDDPLHSVVDRSPESSNGELSPAMAESPFSSNSLGSIKDKFGAMISETLKLDLSPDTKYHQATGLADGQSDHNDGHSSKEHSMDADDDSVRSKLSIRVDSDDSINSAASPPLKVMV